VPQCVSNPLNFEVHAVVEHSQFDSSKSELNQIRKDSKKYRQKHANYLMARQSEDTADRMVKSPNQERKFTPQMRRRQILQLLSGLSSA
jgi:hypothetical protein